MNTIDKLQELLSTPAKEIMPGYYSKPSAPRVVFADGESVSVQASEYTYCSPRENEGPYYQVELGFPSCKPSGVIMQYCEDGENPTDTVYGYVPINFVAAWIDSHGGIKE